MLTIVNETDIEYSYGDTFILPIEAEGDLFDESARMQLIIAKDKTSSALVENTYGFTETGVVLTLTKEDKDKLLPGDYVYKLISTTSDGTITTEISGNFRVKWGA